MKMVKQVTKNILLFIVCFFVAFWLSSYGKPLYAITSAVMDFSYQEFKHTLTQSYEMDLDPITTSTLMFMITLYALVLFMAVKLTIKKIINNE
ncbi:hypothetical protein [Rouxiella sp. Mn2063]|uniref:hypothetical protein n=1 Tax=Rouxiella sp. Mn2063 TaxID=3395262 RepID=UPI003BBA95F4